MTVIIEGPSPTPPLVSNAASLHAVPISERPRRTWAQFFNGLAFGVLFILGVILVNVAQFLLLLPLRVLHPLPFGRRLYDTGVRRSKGAFGTLLGEFYGSRHTLSVLPPGDCTLLGDLLTPVVGCLPTCDIMGVVTMCSWFAPTNLVITFETKGQGKFTEEELEKLVEKDSEGNVRLNLPTKSVLIANHQVTSGFAASCSPLTYR